MSAFCNYSVMMLVNVKLFSSLINLLDSEVEGLFFFSHNVHTKLFFKQIIHTINLLGDSMCTHISISEVVVGNEHLEEENLTGIVKITWLLKFIC